MEEIAVLMTVGTSLIRNIREASGRQGGSLQTYNDREIANQISTHYSNAFSTFDAALRTRDLTQVLENPGFPSAEIQSFCFWLRQKQQVSQVSVKRIVLFPTDTAEAKACSRQICQILKDSVFPAFGISDSDIDITEDPFPVDSADETQFAQDIANFLAKLNCWFKELDQREIRGKILNITAGYKVFAAVLTLLGFQRDDVEVIYQHEDSSLVLTLPPLPMAWDFKVLDEYRSLVQREALSTEPPARFKAFFKQEGTQWKRNTFGDLLRTEYERDRLKRFGYGARLIRRWLPETLQRELEQRIPRWEKIWIGDQIPETVEHSRGHSQRLMEYAAELLEPQLVRNRDFLSSAELYGLICCLWLHDIGHTGLTFRLPAQSPGTTYSDLTEGFRRFLRVWGLKGSQLVQGDARETVEIPVALFPSLVRLFHNFISAQRICHGEYLPVAYHVFCKSKKG